MKLGVLFSGGKDSCYALHQARKFHHVVCLLTMRSQNPDSYMFHTPNIHLTDLQAEALEIPILVQTTKGEKEEELEDLDQLIANGIEQFAIKTWELEREGYIVLGCTLLPRWYCEVPSHFGERTGTKEQCDELNLRKIDLADEVLVLNFGGYIGESTRNEIVYAKAHGKPVRYLKAKT